MTDAVTIGPHDNEKAVRTAGANPFFGEVFGRFP